MGKTTAAVKAALEKAGKVDREAMIGALEDLAISSPTGRVTMGKNHHATMRMFLAKTKGRDLVTVRALGGNRIYVVGKVNHPGEFPFSRPLDVMQSLSLAVGATSFADLNDIRILRRGDDGKQAMISFRYDEVSRGRHLEQNVLLQTGDTVVVP